MSNIKRGKRYYAVNICPKCKRRKEVGIQHYKESYFLCYRCSLKMMEKNKPKKDGSGKGTRANKGRGGCEEPKENPKRPRR